MKEKQTSLEHKSARWGAILSFACAIHCLALPLISVLTPAFGSLLSFTHSYEWVIFLLTMPLGFFMVLRQHNWREESMLPFMLMITALALFIVGFFIHEHTGHYLFAASGIFMAAAQLINMRIAAHRHDCATHS